MHRHSSHRHPPQVITGRIPAGNNGVTSPLSRLTSNVHQRKETASGLIISLLKNSIITSNEYLRLLPFIPANEENHTSYTPMQKALMTSLSRAVNAFHRATPAALPPQYAARRHIITFLNEATAHHQLQCETKSEISWDKRPCQFAAHTFPQSCYDFFPDYCTPEQLMFTFSTGDIVMLEKERGTSNYHLAQVISWRKVFHQWEIAFVLASGELFYVSSISEQQSYIRYATSQEQSAWSKNCGAALLPQLSEHIERRRAKLGSFEMRVASDLYSIPRALAALVTGIEPPLSEDLSLWADFY